MPEAIFRGPHKAFPLIAQDAIFIYTFRDFDSSAASLYDHVIRQR
jgi:hypothetical protein